MENEYKSAKYYDKFLYLFVRRIRYKILKIAQKYKYETILDVCCGTGNQLKLLKKHGFNGIGVDLSEAMLEIADWGKFKANCLEQDAENIDFSDDSFDMTMIAFALHEKSKSSTQKILSEMLRLTKKDGHIIIVDFEISDETFYISRKGINFIESSAGEEHYKHFLEYNQFGGLDTLLLDLPLKEIEKHNFALNGVILKVLQKTN